MVLYCFKCHAEVAFDAEHIGKNGRKIPLDPTTRRPHDCPEREKRFRDADTGEEMRLREDGETIKDDHGNEEVQTLRTTSLQQATDATNELSKYVDHTAAAKGTPQFKVFTNTSADILTIDGNEWIKTHKDQYQVKLIGQLQFDNGTFAITLYYEETKQ